ncbi:DNA-processing protein DprA [Streptomyces sp. SHP 1-2]|uniref:DNA-processing protein DprA n=1 Tax=Streptomyces sp. SHP 1-2 TaxID=2769489 RepID=UPI00223874D0|nr:DNA-processing protein DprA [Streptomyces sp. SHP 1-2]MCW5254420.1 DNA-protecting protein DprA [Streptomyces sp. SHP 1-2]
MTGDGDTTGTAGATGVTGAIGAPGARDGTGATGTPWRGALPPGGGGAPDRDGAADEERLARILLTRVLEPGDATGGRWVRERGAPEVARCLLGPGRALPGVTRKRWSGLRARAAAADPRGDLATAREAGVRFVAPGEAEWPRQLDDLGDTRPLGLWVRGRPGLRMWALRSVAVVGARACTEYGAHMAATLAAGLAERGWVVVSGGAYGVDGAAHRGALGAGGATAAVLACGVDRPYPPGHTALITRIAEQGLVLGELPPGDHPTPSRFVLRNRVIAALTRGTVVVEAAHRSGSLVTARAAARLGRHVMGVPGPATSGLSAGVHELLRGEAVLVTDADEITELVGGMGELAPERRGPVLPTDLLEPGTRQVLAALPARGAATAAEIARGAGTAPDDAVARLYELRALGYVERHGDDWKLTRQTTISVRGGRDPR